MSKSSELKEAEKAKGSKKPENDTDKVKDLQLQLDGLKANFGSNDVAKSGAKDTPNQLTANGKSGQENNIKVDGGDKGDQLNVRGGDKADNVMISGGSGKDQINYTATPGNDNVDINGGGGGDTLNIRAGDENLSVVGPDGKAMYSRGEGGSKINVSGVDNVNVSGADGKPLYNSKDAKAATDEQTKRWKIMQDVETKIFETPAGPIPPAPFGSFRDR